MAQDPLSRWPIKNSPKETPKNDALSRWPVKGEVKKIEAEPEKESEKEPEVPVTEDTELSDLERLASGLPPAEEQGMLSAFWDAINKSALPESKSREYTPETLPPFFDRAIDEFGRGVYENVVRPTASGLGAATTVLGGPITRGALKIAGKIPALAKLGEMLIKKRSLFGKVDDVAGEVIPGGEAILPQAKVDPVGGGLTFADEVTRMPGGQNAGMYGITGGDNMFPSVPGRMQGPSTNQTVFDALLPSSVKAQIGQSVKLGADGVIAPLGDDTAKLASAVTPEIKPINEAADELAKNLKDLNLRKLNKEQADIYTKERAARIEKVKHVDAQGEEGFYKQKGELSGAYEKIEIEPLRAKLGQTHIDQLMNQIEAYPWKDKFNMIHAKEGFVKLLEGVIPQDNELNILGRVFGKEMFGSIPTPARDHVSHLREGYNLFRGLISVDLPFMTSAAFRQAKSLAWTKDWFKAWKTSAQSFGSRKLYESKMSDIRSRPLFEAQENGKSIAEGWGLRIHDLKNFDSRDEMIRSQWAEKIPIWGRYVTASNRSYTAFLNDLSTNTLEALVDDAAKLGRDPLKDPKLGRELAEFVNDAVSRGNIAAKIPFTNKEVSLERHSSLLGEIFFSPRNTAQSIKMLNPSTYIYADPLVRKEYMKGMMRTMSTWALMAGMGKLAGSQISFEPSSADFVKVKIGNTRFEISGGLSRYLVLAGQMQAGGKTSSTTGEFDKFGEGFKPETMASTIANFATNMLHPTLGAGVRAASATEHRPFGVADEALGLVLPMYTADIKTVLEEDPSLLPLVLGAGSVGFGSQTYGKNTENSNFIPRDRDFVFPKKTNSGRR